MVQITLEAARRNVGLTQKEVAEKVHRHQQTISKYEEDSTKIPLDLLMELSSLYGVELNNIFLGKKYELKRIL